MIPRFSPDYHWKDFTHCMVPADRNSVSELERKFAELTHHECAIAFRYGRSGLYFLLKALGAKNKKVILPSYTCVVVAHAISLSGNIPVFLDNAPSSFQPNPEAYFNAIDADTVMVIPTHLFGIAEETKELYRKTKEKHPSVFVLQDCAHSFFCKDSTGQVVTRYGDGAIFGMNISKLVNSVYGGMLTLADKGLEEKVRRLQKEEASKRNKSAGVISRSYAAAATLAFTAPGYNVVHWLSKNSKLLDSETKYFDANTIELPKDFAVPLLPFEAQMGLRSLKRFRERVEKRSRIAKYYIEKLRGIQGIEVPNFTSGHTWSHFPLLVPQNKRDLIRHELERRYKVEIGVIVDYSVAELPTYKKIGLSCPRALDSVGRILNLPLTFEEGIYPHSDWEKRVKGICRTIQELGSIR